MITYTDPFPGRKGSERIVRPCGKCSGAGRLAHYAGILGGVCFACNGAGSSSVLISSLRATERSRVKAANAAAEAQAARLKARDEWEAAGYADLLAKLDAAIEGLRNGDPILRDAEYAREGLMDYANAALGVYAVESVLGAIQAREEAKRPVPTGRVEIEGVILSTKFVENGFGGALKMLVEGNGWKVWGSVPSSFDYVELKGAHVRFTAAVEASADDASFGFYKRPTKAEILG